MKLLMLAGDGVGAEVMPEVGRVVQWFIENHGLEAEVHEEPFGLASWRERGTLMSDDTWSRIEAADAILFGAIGTGEYSDIPPEEHQVDWLLEIRRALDLFANLRPVRVRESLLEASTLKPEVIRGVDLVIVRELAGGAYFGEPRGFEVMTDGSRRAVNSIVYTTEEVRRIARAAFDLARARDGRVCSVDKANVLEVGTLPVARHRGAAGRPGVPRGRAVTHVRRQLCHAAGP